MVSDEAFESPQNVTPLTSIKLGRPKKEPRQHVLQVISGNTVLIYNRFSALTSESCEIKIILVIMFSILGLTASPIDSFGRYGMWI